MPRPKSKTPDQLISAAMLKFWISGFSATSMDELVTAIGSSRHAIYSECGGKNELFVKCLQYYQDKVVTPAFENVEAEDADFSAIEEYFHIQIDRAEAMGQPYPGCLVANTTAETSSHSKEVMHAIDNHNARLKAGFENALVNSVGRETTISTSQLDELAEFLAASAQGLWLFSKRVKHIDMLRSYANTLTSLVKNRISQ